MVAYVAVTLVLAVLVFVWPTTNVLAWVGLLLLTLPVSLPLTFLTYVGTALVLGPGESPIALGVVLAVIWTTAAAAQALAFASICHTRRGRANA